jgi:hypothetical protein
VIVRYAIDGPLQNGAKVEQLRLRSVQLVNSGNWFAISSLSPRARAFCASTDAEPCSPYFLRSTLRCLASSLRVGCTHRNGVALALVIICRWPKSPWVGWNANSCPAAQKLIDLNAFCGRVSLGWLNCYERSEVLPRRVTGQWAGIGSEAISILDLPVKVVNQAAKLLHARMRDGRALSSPLLIAAARSPALNVVDGFSAVPYSALRCLSPHG